MVTGQLTRSEAEQALRRLEGLRDDWAKQRLRWSEHHQKAADIKTLQRNPSAALIYTTEACCNQMGIATIRFNQLERLIQDFRSCALYLVHLPVPEGPDATFRSALPDLWSIPHSAPGTSAVALPGRVAGFTSEMAPLHSIQGLSDQIQMQTGTPSSGYYADNHLISSNASLGHIQPTGFQYQQLSHSNPMGFQSNMPPAAHYPLGGGTLQPTLGQFTNPSQPLTPQHTQLLYNQQLNLQQQSAQQASINAFSANVFQQHQPLGPASMNSHQYSSSPLNPFNPTPPHGAVLDASQKYPAVQ